MAKTADDLGIKLTVSITRNYGRVSASFGAEQIIYPDTNDSPRAGYAVLLDFINDQFAHYESAVLHTTPADPIVYDNKGAGAKPEIVPCELMHVSVDKGKTVYRITGGRYTKFGVMIYPEVLSQYKDLDTLKAGVAYPMTGWKMAVDTTKAAKVVQLLAPA